jgi:hypothetical protein
MSYVIAVRLRSRLADMQIVGHVDVRRREHCRKHNSDHDVTATGSLDSPSGMNDAGYNEDIMC